jgi:hypothetical protein
MSRPYVGEYLWFLATYYGAVYWRARFTTLNLKNGKGREHWHENDATRAIVRWMLTDDEFDKYSGLSYGRLKYLQQVVEPKILAAIDSVASGKQQSDETLKHGMALHRELSTLPLDPLGVR